MSVKPRGYSTDDAKAMIPCSHTKLYELIGEGKLVAKKLGRKTIITATSLNRFIAEMPIADIKLSERVKSKNRPA